MHFWQELKLHKASKRAYEKFDTTYEEKQEDQLLLGDRVTRKYAKDC